MRQHQRQNLPSCEHHAHADREVMSARPSDTDQSTVPPAVGPSVESEGCGSGEPGYKVREIRRLRSLQVDGTPASPASICAGSRDAASSSAAWTRTFGLVTSCAIAGARERSGPVELLSQPRARQSAPIARYHKVSNHFFDPPLCSTSPAERQVPTHWSNRLRRFRNRLASDVANNVDRRV